MPRAAQLLRPASTRRSGGFTLMELMMVILVIGICAGLVLAAFSGDIRGGRLSTAANVLASDIEFCQQECIANPAQPRSITFNTSANKYSITYKDAVSGNTVVLSHPIDGQPFTNDFSTGRSAGLSGVRISSVTVGGVVATTVQFTSYGLPSNLTADCIITLAYNARTMTVTIKSTTGDVVIQ